MTPILNDVLADLILPNLRAASSKQVLQSLATEIALRTAMDETIIAEQLIEQERYNNSGIGAGVAIPHVQIEGLLEPLMIFARLERGVDFGALDNQNADLVFLLASPAGETATHLRRLSRISRLLRNNELCAHLRKAKTADDMRALLGEPETWLVAA